MLRRKLLILFFLCFGFMASFAQNTVVEQANGMIAEQKYATAFQLLNGSDPNNQDPDICISKSNLLLNFYVKTELFQWFGLKDIAPNQDLNDFRDRNVYVPMFDYKPDSILSKLIRQYPQNYHLRNALGNFYYEVHLKYPDNWLIADSLVVDNMKSNYLEAYNHGVYDYWSLFGIGYAYLLDEDYEEGIPFFLKSIELNNSYPLSYYNLAFAYSNTDQYDKCLTYAQKAYDLQTIPEFKAEAARLIAMNYQDMKNEQKALEYFRIADQILPNDYNTLLPMLTLEMKLDDKEYKKHTNQLFFLAPDNPVIYQDLLKAYSENDNEKEYIEFMENLKPQFKQNIMVLSNILFHEAIAQYDMDDWVAAKINFEKARNLFRNIFKPDHAVFKVIDSYTNAIKKK